MAGRKKSIPSQDSLRSYKTELEGKRTDAIARIKIANANIQQMVGELNAICGEIKAVDRMMGTELL